LGLLIQSSAAILLVLFETLEKLEKQFEELTKDNKEVRWLCGHRGIAVLTAATIMAEIVDVRRFPTNNHLTSYAGPQVMRPDQVVASIQQRDASAAPRLPGNKRSLSRSRSLTAETVIFG